MIFRYADNSRFVGDWRDAPGYGVQTIVYEDGGTVVLRHQGDFYRMAEDGYVVPMDMMSLLHYVIDDLKLVKAGSMVSQKKWDVIFNATLADQHAIQLSNRGAD